MSKPTVVPAVVNIPEAAVGDKAFSASVSGSPKKTVRIPSFTGSDGNRRRRKPFKSSSNHSLKATHSQMLSNHAHDPSKAVYSGALARSGAESHDGSEVSHSTYAASQGAPSVRGFHVQPSSFNDRSVVGDSPRGGRVDTVFDDGTSSVAESLQTSATTSSNTGVSREHKRLIKPDHEGVDRP